MREGSSGARAVTRFTFASTKVVQSHVVVVGGGGDRQTSDPMNDVRHNGRKNINDQIAVWLETVRRKCSRSILFFFVHFTKQYFRSESTVFSILWRVPKKVPKQIISHALSHMTWHAQGSCFKIEKRFYFTTTTEATTYAKPVTVATGNGQRLHTVYAIM